MSQTVSKKLKLKLCAEMQWDFQDFFWTFLDGKGREGMCVACKVRKKKTGLS